MNRDINTGLKALVLSALVQLLPIADAQAQVSEETITYGQMPNVCDYACQLLFAEFMNHQFQMMDGGGGNRSNGTSSGNGNQSDSDWCKGIGPGTATAEERRLFNVFTGLCILGTLTGGPEVGFGCAGGVVVFAESICSD